MESSLDGTIDVGDARDANMFDAWAGCPSNPVVCPDANYYITINGGTPDALLTNYWYASDVSPGDAGYHIPLARFIPPGEFPGFYIVWASSATDASPNASYISIYADPSVTASWIEYGPSPNPNSADYVSWITDSGANVVYTQFDPPGGVVAGSYSVALGDRNAPDSGTLFISGSFFACRICDGPPM